MKTETKIFLFGGLLTLVLIIGAIFLLQPKNESGSQTSSSSKELIPVDAVTHGHGLTVDSADPNKLYIATHYGLLVLVNEKDLYQVGEKKDDYMGFSPHPSNPKVFFTSGHPSFGGNLGFQRSDDGGFTWTKISNGVNGPVDFHAMTVSPVNPHIIYGWYMGSLQRSMDEGKSWEKVATNLSEVISLLADPKDESTVYAATTQGILVSKDKGKEWVNLSDDLTGSAVTVLAIDPQNPQQMLSYSQKLGLAKTSDSGKTWESIKENFGEDLVFHMSIDKQNPENIYALTKSNSIYKSIDSGTTWNKIR